ncbi:hypothetical protein [Mesorhizobium sp. GbtcB19]|uniref:hypothetical protein n=1 Tax=Mesorhizobium sp. GbtcB19 TaxID=2824764 RepID=UPI001C30E4DA|nr:hypothetical protein [Mesorhizobium sp. GbtcB19]
MTPLALQILNDLCLPLRSRQMQDPDNVLRHMPAAKCFECSALGDFMTSLARENPDPDPLYEAGRIFAPAPVTFLEMKSTNRFGVLLLEKSDGSMELHAATDAMLGFLFIGVLKSSRQQGNVWFTQPSQTNVAMRDALLIAIGVVYQLFLINTPKLLGNITRLPHAGLQKKLARAQGMTGKFPLFAWTEITLWATPDGSKANAENAEIEAHLSGRKCLHFVRAFLRWRMGRPEIVSSHWKGDPSLGMRRSRYKMAA